MAKSPESNIRSKVPIGSYRLGLSSGDALRLIRSLADQLLDKTKRGEGVELWTGLGTYVTVSVDRYTALYSTERGLPHGSV